MGRKARKAAFKKRGKGNFIDWIFTSVLNLCFFALVAGFIFYLLK